MDKQALFGYAGKILIVDLSSQQIRIDPLEYSFARKYLGGAGFLTHWLLEELPPHVDPLSPENILIFALGPVTGVALTGSGRNCVGAKSPLTGTIAKSEVGGFWGAQLKRAGFDAIIIKGKAAQPVYLWIHDGEVEIRAAGKMWGAKTKETVEMIKGELADDKVHVAVIGPAGERMVRYASLSNGLYSSAGRGGLGAVMGSKNLKAIAVRGSKNPEVANPEAVKELRQWIKTNESRTRGLHDFGTGRAMVGYVTIGNLPIHNWRDGIFPGANKIDAIAIKENVRIGMEGCFACPIACKKVVKVDDPYSVDPAYGGPEYETLAALGSNCGIDDLKTLCKANELCNAYSLDTISTGATIAFAMECFERGILTKADIGFDLNFGDAEAMLKVIELIAMREGIGKVLAEGSARAAVLIGKGATELAVHVKGQEPGLHDPRMKYAIGLGYMVGPYGADHCLNMADVYATAEQMKQWEPLGILEPRPAESIDAKTVALFKAEQFKKIIVDSMVLCMLPPYGWKELCTITEAVTGWNTGIPELLLIAERVLTAARLFNIREGFSVDDDVLPKRLLQPRIGGSLDGKALDPVKFEHARSYYYTLMGWDPKTGIPLQDKLEALGLS